MACIHVKALHRAAFRQEVASLFRRHAQTAAPICANSSRNLRLRCSVADRSVAGSSSLKLSSEGVREERASGDSKISIPILGLHDIISRLQEEARDERFKDFRSMYSSVVGGITTDVAMMVVPLDDHMVHRGHSVFDTCVLVNGNLYELDAHLDRFHRSIAKAKISPPFDRATIREILVQTVAAGKCQNGILRYWMSVGRGDFNLSSKDCTEACLYACFLEEDVLEEAAPEGVKVVTTTVPIKDKFFATVKSTNYLPNALVAKEAEEKGAQIGIWLDEEGNIAEGQNMNVGFLTREGELLLPTFDWILSGCTARRLLELVPELVKENAIPGLKGVRLAKISVEEARKASEMIMIVSGWVILPVVEWDGIPVGNGKPGPVSQALLRCMQQDMLSAPPALLTPVPS